MSNLLKQLKKVLQSPGSPKKKPQAKSTREEVEHIRQTQREDTIQRSHSSLPSIQAQSSEADEHLSYLDPRILVCLYQILIIPFEKKKKSSICYTPLLTLYFKVYHHHHYQ